MLFNIICIWWFTKTLIEKLEEIKTLDIYYEEYLIYLIKFNIVICIGGIGVATYSFTENLNKFIIFIGH